MRAYLLSLSLLATVAVSLSTSIEPWFQNWQGNRTKSANALQIALGDGRRLFANQTVIMMKKRAFCLNPRTGSTVSAGICIPAGILI
jgi:hypothetical protein